MKRWTAYFAVACAMCGNAGSSIAQSLEAKASFMFNGQQITIDKNNTEAAEYAAAFAMPSDTCGATCIAPMQAADGVPTLGETEVLAFLVETVATNKGLLVDARMPDDRARGFIPGSVSLPYAAMVGSVTFRQEILEALGASATTEGFDFSEVQHLLVYDTGPSTDDAGTLIAQLIAAGYPTDKISYYRGGMQVWSVLGFSIEDGL